MSYIYIPFEKTTAPSARGRGVTVALRNETMTTARELTGSKHQVLPDILSILRIYSQNWNPDSDVGSTRVEYEYGDGESEGDNEGEGVRMKRVERVRGWWGWGRWWVWGGRWGLRWVREWGCWWGWGWGWSQPFTLFTLHHLTFYRCLGTNVGLIWN